MITIIRKHQKALMLIVAVLTIIAFALLYNPAEPQELGANVAAAGYGRTFTRADIDRMARLFQLALSLGQAEFVSGLSGQAPDENSMVGMFVFNLIVLREESRALGIEPAPAQIVERVRQMPAFHTKGAFDPAKFEQFATTRLGALGMTTLQIEEVARDAIRFERLTAAVGGIATVSPAEMARAQRLFQKANLLVVRFPRDTAQITVSEADARALFDRNRQMFVMPEAVTIEAAEFTLDEASAKLEGKERVSALQELAGKAEAFVAGLTGNFSEAATAAGAKVTASGPIDRAAATIAGDLPPAVAQAAYLLDPQRPTSDVMQVNESFFVFRVTERRPERQLEFEEARPAAEARLREMQAARMAEESAARAIAEIRKAVADGRTIEEATAGMKTEKLDGIEPFDATLPSNLQIFAQVSALLEPGQISNFIPAGVEGGAVAVLSRALPGEESPSELADLDQRLLGAKREILVTSWLHGRGRAAGLRQR